MGSAGQCVSVGICGGAGLRVTPSTPRNPMQRLPVDNYSMWLLPWGPGSLSDLWVQAAVGLFVLSLSAPRRPLLESCLVQPSPAPSGAFGGCLLSWVLRGKKIKIVVFSVAVIISKYSDGDKMLFQLPLVNINSRRSLSQ